MTFTALHRSVGAPPGPVTDALITAAVAQQIAETDDLDYKSSLPPTRGITQTDFPKDVAAMANSGGGVIIYGVTEAEKRATGRADVGELTEIHERSLRSAAITAISPPVFGLGVHRTKSDSGRAVVVEVPASVDGPHLIYHNEFFGAPMRNDADTVWMKERQIEAMYRARFDERRRASDALDRLYDEASGGRDTDKRAWVVAVAHPRLPLTGQRFTRDQAAAMLRRSETLTLTFSKNLGHPLEDVNMNNPRPGLRRWTAANAAIADWREAWASIHHDGSVTIAAAAGAFRKSRDEYAKGHQVLSTRLECAAADLMAMTRAVSETAGGGEYEVRVGIEWRGDEPLSVLTVDNVGRHYDEVSTPLHRYTPVDATVDVTASELEFHAAVHDLAEDVVNQGGTTNLQAVKPVPTPSV